MIVVLGELGGQDEYSLVEAMQSGRVTKPVVAWVSGTVAKLFKSEVQFGHAGARSGGDKESAQAKNAALRAAGALVPDSYEGFEDAIRCAAHDAGAAAHDAAAAGAATATHDAGAAGTAAAAALGLRVAEQCCLHIQ